MKKQCKYLRNTITKLLAAALLVAMLPVTAYAETGKDSLNAGPEQEVYYTNDNGVDFTKEQYDRLREFYSENEIEIMQPGFAEPLFEDLYGFTVANQYLYVQTLESVDADGNVVTTERETVLTEEQAENLDELDLDKPDRPQRNYSATHTTASKLITMKLNLGANTASVSLTCSWKKLPKTKSYDIMAIASSEFTYFQGASNFSASVKGDGKTTASYGESSSAVKIQNGAYQHCTSSISLSDSQKYNIKRSILSMGGVLDFTSSSVEDKYDDTTGLSVSGSI